MKKGFISLKIKFFFIALVVAIVPSVVVGLAMYQESIEVVEQKQEAAVQNSLENISDTILVTLKYARSTSLNIISNKDVRSALLLENPSADVALKWHNQIAGSFFSYMGLSTYIDGIYLVGHNGIEVESDNIDESLVADNLEKLQEARGGAVWTWMENDEGGNFVLLREIRDTENPSVSLGYLQIVVRSDVIREQLATFSDTFSGYISLWDTGGMELISFGECLEDKAEVGKILQASKSFNYLNRDGILTYYKKVKDHQWVLIGSLEASSLFAEGALIKEMLIKIVFATLAVALVVVFLFARMITQPLKELTEQTKEISRDNYDIHLNIESNDEIGILSENFNEMAKRLDELVNEVLRGQVLQQEAQFNALQTQINPHFLYNNLDTAYWMSRMEKADKTGKILLALSKLYRSITNTNRKIISVEDEAKYARDYITIQELRLGNQISFDLCVEESAKQLSTLRFMLQPLIENSIEHGILPTGEPGSIAIRIYQDEQFLYYEVEDSGKGTSAEEITGLLEAAQIEGSRGLAIRNIHQRLRIHYGTVYGLTFQQAEGGGILTIVRQPVVEYVKEPEKTET